MLSRMGPTLNRELQDERKLPDGPMARPDAPLTAFDLDPMISNSFKLG